MAMHEHDGALAAKPSAPFYGILFDSLPGAWTLTAMEEPEFFGDLNLDQVVESITAGREEYDLKPYFHHPLRRPESVEYRHEVFRDLEDDGLRDRVQSFARRLRDMRQHLGRVTKAWHEYQKKRWFLDAVQIYCDAVSVLTHDLEVASLSGLRRKFVGGWSCSAGVGWCGGCLCVLVDSGE
jgi:DNA mismatch repair protein MutS